MSPIVVLTPLALEHSSLAAAMSADAQLTVVHPDGVKQIRIDDQDFYLAVGGHGKVQFALTTQLLIQRHKPSLVVCAGAAGALHPELNAFDVVLADHTIEHDFNLRFTSRPLPQFPADTAAFEKIRRRFERQTFELHVGPLASGDEDIIEPTRALEIRSKTDAIAVAWEGAGGARACRLHGVGFLEIRGITDAADPAAAQNFTANLKQAMANVGHVIRLLG